MDAEYYLAADKRFYEKIDARPVQTADFLDFISGSIDDGWALIRKGIWINCHYRRNQLPLQGWKIHLSSVPNQAKRLLEVAAPYLIENKVSFKFLADAATLRMTASKSWGRGATGKFITVYPLDENHFKELLTKLDALTRDFAGPYILSDKRYGHSKVLYYRYGGIRPNSRLQEDGRRTPVLVAPDGREIEDVRRPTYQLPAWAPEPFPETSLSAENRGLNGGRYAVERALHFSTTGGVYIARDAETGKQVVLKEARAHAHSFSDVWDAASMLRNEYEILGKIAPQAVAPQPVELFQEWEHLFLAEEYLEGYVTIRKFHGLGCLFVETAPTPEKVAAYLNKDLVVLKKLAAIVDTLHAAGILWGDISFNNILVHPETLDVKIIDLESARLAAGPQRPRVGTAGFFDVNRPKGQSSAIEDDYYGVGAVMFFMLTSLNKVLEQKPQAWREILSEIGRDFAIPERLLSVVTRLLDEDAGRRPRPSVLLDQPPIRPDEIGPILLRSQGAASPAARERLAATVEQSCRFIKASAELHRKDRMFPADPLVFETNPLSLAHGAAGVLLALKRIEGSAPSEAVDRLAQTALSAQDCPPGLYLGLAGAAWSLLELGRAQEACAVMERTFAAPPASSDLYYGLAGWGMANLRLWLATRRPAYLQKAEDAGRRLVETAQERDGALFWPDRNGLVSYGLAHGSSGIALFLLYLDRALGGRRFEKPAVRALEFDLAHATEVSWGTLSWRRDESGDNVVVPYWRHGSGGVGIAVLRFWKALGEPRYRTIIDKIHADCDRKYSIFPGRNDGLAGVGEFLLDAFDATGDRKFLESAHKAAGGLMLFHVPQPEGAAFLGNGLSRISCDLATGSGGIALFLDRLLKQAPGALLLDELLS